MKKSILVLVALVAILASLVVTGLAFAQSGTPADPGAVGRGFGRGMMGGNTMQGMMGGRLNVGEGYGPMHTYMVDAFAEALAISPEDLQAALDSGKTMWDVAEEQGKTQEEFAELMVTARTSALNQAVDDGVITREQGDWMIARMAARMEGLQANGYGPGNCPMQGGQGGFGPGMMRAWRWNP
jgi:hypothetical protein